MKTGTGRNLTMLCNNKSIYHAQTHTYTIAPEMEEWETKDTQGPEFALKKVLFTASVDGLACVKESSDASVEAHDTPDMIAAALKGQAVDVVAKLALDENAPKEYAVKCIIENIEVSESVGAKTTYKASLKGYNPTEMTKPEGAVVKAAAAPAKA